MATLTRRSCFTYSAVVITVVLLLVIIFALLPPKCELIKEKPTTDLTKVKLLKDQTANARAKLAGHLKYKTDNATENIYLPLDFNEMNVIIKHNDKMKIYSISITSECVRLLVLYQHSDTTTTIKRFFVTLEHPNGKQKTCGIDNPKGVWFPANSHYKCAETKQYDCYEDKPEDPNAKPALVATLVFDYLEFEVEGNKESYDEDKFSTPGTPACPS